MESECSQIVGNYDSTNYKKKIAMIISNQFLNQRINQLQRINHLTSLRGNLHVFRRSKRNIAQCFK